ncbi:alpha-L-fucosidase [Actinomadura sp. 6N118]|uniref:alpha-L-fucosidase n=1 Tax=Actinomadura sp. 6N118 TaxID=3375151 RepID=UPI0037AB4D57
MTLHRRTFLGAGAALPLLAATPASASRSMGNRYRLQKRFVDWRFGMFLHFNMGTYHDAEWVEPDQDPRSFNPTHLDCGQWADAAKAAGMKFGVLTAKHHDGFCLWPTKKTDYKAQRDIVREYVDAFRSRGLTPCLYFSIWDRTNGVGPKGFDDRPPITREAIDFVKAQLTELLTGYGPIPLLILDGWAWHWAFNHQTIPWHEIREHISSLQPNCLVLDLNGLAVPWHSDLLFIEETKGGVFCPPGNTYAASQGQTIAPAGWFWHPSTPTNLLTPSQIVDGHLAKLEPRYCTFILNCPPNPQGLLDDTVVQTLQEVGRQWRPAKRPPLPRQPDVVSHPLTPTTATATTGEAANAIDGHSDFGWNGQADQTLWTTSEGPQSITIDLGKVFVGIDVLTYLPRQDTAKDFVLEDFVTTGNITSYRISASTNGKTFRPLTQGTWSKDHTLKEARFRPTIARYLRLETPGPAIASEIGCGGLRAKPRPLR